MKHEKYLQIDIDCADGSIILCGIYIFTDQGNTSGEMQHPSIWVMRYVYLVHCFSAVCMAESAEQLV